MKQSQIYAILGRKEFWIMTIAVALVHDYRLLVSMLFCQATVSVVFFPVGIMIIAKVASQNERGLFTAIAVSAAGILVRGSHRSYWEPLPMSGIFQIGILMVRLLTTSSTLCLRWFDDV